MHTVVTLCKKKKKKPRHFCIYIMKISYFREKTVQFKGFLLTNIVHA